jgi:hypothetical protein
MQVMQRCYVRGQYPRQQLVSTLGRYDEDRYQQIHSTGSKLHVLRILQAGRQPRCGGGLIPPLKLRAS